MKNTLYIGLNGATIGFIQHDPFEDNFEINLNDKELHLSPHVFSGAHSGAVKRFLMNLLPEGNGLDELAGMLHISKGNTFGLIQAIGSETTGAVSFHSGQDEHPKTSFREIKPEELTERILNRSTIPITIWDNQPRLSVAGVQEKLPVMILRDGRIGFGNGNFASTHILKFGKNAGEHIVLNEFLCMTLANKLKIPVAEVKFVRFGEPILQVKRFDRNFHDNEVDKLHVIDGCQMLDMPPSYKYERVYGDSQDVKNFREGASLEKIFGLAKSCTVPAVATRDILNRVLFNLLIGNCDAHGKNISWYFSKEGVRIAPGYDMLSISIYKEKYNQNLAMAVGNSFSSRIYAYDLSEMCELCGLQPRFVARTLEKLCKSALAEIHNLTSDLNLKDDEIDFANQLSALIENNAKWYIDAAKELPKIK